jgi:hypothetical protein
MNVCMYLRKCLCMYIPKYVCTYICMYVYMCPSFTFEASDRFLRNSLYISAI